MDDQELVTAVARGDDGALRELTYRHTPWLAARLRAVLPAPDIEDVLQETFLAVWRGARGYRPDGPAAGWLWGIARRQAALFLRRRGPLAFVPQEADEPVDADPAEAAAVRVDLERAVADLGAPGAVDREVFRLMYEEDCSVSEVAALMGVPVGTVKSRAHRARRLLRRSLGGGPAMEGGAR